MAVGGGGAAGVAGSKANIVATFGGVGVGAAAAVGGAAIAVVPEVGVVGRGGRLGI